MIMSPIAPRNRPPKNQPTALRPFACAMIGQAIRLMTDTITEMTAIAVTILNLLLAPWGYFLQVYSLGAKMSIKSEEKIMEILIADRVGELMREQGLNQVQLAAKIGVKQNTISAWLLRKKEPCITSLWLLADYFDVSVDYLIGRRDF